MSLSWASAWNGGRAREFVGDARAAAAERSDDWQEATLVDTQARIDRAAQIAEASAPPSRRREILSAWADSLAGLGRHNEAYGLSRRALATG